ncbi:MAG: DUF4291 domain-containing protein [Lyngbya sp.]|nr:DUF4291 domain-containing protein [Lyngbya sp.]
MKLLTESYLKQVQRWPQTGYHILAQFDETSVIVYQAYRREIGDFAAKHGYFGGEFRLNRMSWIKPNFLWMMYRSGWGTKAEQEVTLAVRIQRTAFDNILKNAVHSSFIPDIYSTEKNWKQAVQNSEVRLQWDPDHNPVGDKLERRAIQLGLRGEFLKKYAQEWIVEIEDISNFVREQYQVICGGDWRDLKTPTETVYPVASVEVSQKLGLSKLEKIGYNS